MEKVYEEEDLLNSTGIPSDDDADMDLELEQTEIGKSVKRRKLIDQFDALSLQDDFDMQFNSPDEITIRRFEHNFAFEEKIDCGKRRNKKWLLKNKYINSLRKECNSENTKFNKTMKKLRRTKTRNLQKNSQAENPTSQTFQNYKIEMKSRITFEENLLKLLEKLREVCPKIFRKLENLSNRYFQRQICSGTENRKFLHSLNQGANDHLCKEVLIFVQTQTGMKIANIFMQKLYKNLKSSELFIIQKNAELSEKLIHNSLKKLEEDFDMIEVDDLLKANQLCLEEISDQHQFDFGDCPIWEKEIDYIEPISYCTVEELV